MAKLYAEIASDKGGRIASKGGNESITITIKHRNNPLWEIVCGSSTGLLQIRRVNSSKMWPLNPLSDYWQK